MEEGGKEALGGDFLLTPWPIGIKYLKKITICYTNIVISLTIVTKIETYFLPFSPPKIKWDHQFKNIPCGSLVAIF